MVGGPKIRIGAIVGESFDLELGQELLLDSGIDDAAGTPAGLSYQCETWAASCSAGRVLMLDDGRVQLGVLSIDGDAIN